MIEQIEGGCPHSYSWSDPAEFRTAIGDLDAEN